MATDVYEDINCNCESIKGELYKGHSMDFSCNVVENQDIKQACLSSSPSKKFCMENIEPGITKFANQLQISSKKQWIQTTYLDIYNEAAYIARQIQWPGIWYFAKNNIKLL